MGSPDARPFRSRWGGVTGWRRITAAGAGALAVAAVAVPAANAIRSGSTDPAPVVVLQLGDSARVAGAPLVCTVRKRTGVTGIECERRPRTAGALGARLAAGQVAVFRFVDARTAKTIYSARVRGRRLTVCRRS